MIQQLSLLKEYLRGLTESGTIDLLEGDKVYGIRVGAKPFSVVFAFYAGELTTAAQSIQFSADMGRFSKLCVDAACLRNRGPVFGAGLLNHKCAGFNSRSRVEWYDDRPVLVFETIGVVQPFTELTALQRLESR